MNKNPFWRLSLMTVFASMLLCGRTSALFAAEDDSGGPGERLDRLERRVSEMAQRQEQLLRRLGAQQEGQTPPAVRGAERFRPRMPAADVPNLAAPLAPEAIPPQLAPSRPGGPSLPADLRGGKKIADLLGLFLLVAFVFNILVAVWIYTDIRKRGEGPGIFIALALLAGVPAAIIYAIVRIGDRKG